MHNLFLFAFSLSLFLTHFSAPSRHKIYFYLKNLCKRFFFGTKIFFPLYNYFLFRWTLTDLFNSHFLLAFSLFFFLLLLFYIYKLFLDHSSHISQIIHAYICVDSSYFSLTLFIYIGKKFCSLFTFF